MKSITLTLLLSVPTFALASVDCAKVGRSTYPVSDQAKHIAKVMQVKTCDSDSFKAGADKLKQQINLVSAPDSLIKQLEEEKQNKLAKKLNNL